MKKNTSLCFVLIILLAPWCALIKGMEKDRQWNGEYYHQNSIPQYRNAMEHIAQLDLSTCYHIVDLGCGSGKITAEIAHKAPQAQVYGVDNAQDMIAKARSTYDKMSNLHFICADIQKNLPFNNDCSDLIISFACLHWVKNKQAVFDAIARVLKPRGLVLTRSGSKKEDHPLLRAINALKNNPQFKFSEHLDLENQFFHLKEDHALQLLQHSGLTPRAIFTEYKTNTFANKEELANWFSGFFGGFPSIACLSNDEQQFVINALVDEYIAQMLKDDNERAHHEKKLIGDDGAINYYWPDIVIKAQKQ